MSKFDQLGSVAEKKVSGFLLGKPIWVYWIAFTVLIGLVFGISFAIINLLTLRWWAMLLAIIIAGMAAGSFAYLRDVDKTTVVHTM